MELDTVFETERLVLRPYTMDDAAWIYDVFGDDESMRYSTCGVMSYETVLEDLKHNLETRFPEMAPLGERIMVRKKDDVVVGFCGLERVEDVRHDVAEVTYNTSRTYWGNGYATEGAMVMRDHAFGDLGLGRLVASIHCENRRSIRVTEKIGLRHVRTSGSRRMYAMERWDFDRLRRSDTP